MMIAGQSKGKPRVLVVEDDPALLTMVSRLVGTIADVVTATDGQQALELLQAGPPPDLVLSDVMMPRMDGLTLSRKMKADPKLAKVPVILLTAKGDPGDVIAGINTGARAYLTKPFKADDLLGKVRKALNIKETKPMR